jgi:hypothetical protein
VSISKISNRKKQIPNKHQNSKKQFSKHGETLEFEVFENWNLFVICDLLFGNLLSSSHYAQ